MDLDGDGIPDLVSGSWPGELFFFKGRGKGQFDAPVKLKDKFGKTINIGGGIRKDPGGMLLIAGDATFEQKDGKTFLLYEGERIEVKPDQEAGITGTASAVHVADWNGDGVPDLIVGDISGQVHLVPNEGTRIKYAFGKPVALEAGGKPIQVPGGDAGPYVADWDGDGKPDLVVGAGDGSVWFYRNVGTAKEPKLAAGEMLVGPGAGYGTEVSKEPRRGMRAKVCVVDWNGDGRPDLLVGDFTTQKAVRPEPTAAEKAAQDKLRAELEVTQNQWRVLLDKVHGPARLKDKEQRDKVAKELQAVGQKMQELQQKIPPEHETHGWVWLFLRKPAPEKAAAK